VVWLDIDFPSVPDADLVDDARPLLLGLFDILYSYAYDVRTTLGEHNVESAWTVAKISPSLAWLEVRRSPSNVVCWLVLMLR
jgi:protein SHQ1